MSQLQRIAQLCVFGVSLIIVQPASANNAQAIASTAEVKGKLSNNIRIDSKVLDYALQYRVYTPPNLNRSNNQKLPTIYLADGQWYIDSGNMTDILDEEITSGRIKPVIAVFVDNRNPDNLDENRRNAQFFCNPDYVSFYQQELLPTIEANYPASNNRDDRVIQGLSFGGYNAACFGLMAHQQFGGISMQSPANSKMLKQMQSRYSESAKLPLKMFMSFGNKGDNEVQGRKFRDVLLKKGYDLQYKEVNFGHEWKNWRPLLDDSLRRFFATGS
ncbi:MAG: enterochelin esterase-like enzyme [Phenylobacterium sp.]|jgi:enterochelin esterase-like enzyme